MPIIGVIDHRPMAGVTVRILGCFGDMMGRGFPVRPEVATGCHTVTEVRKDIGTAWRLPHQVMAGQTVVDGVRHAAAIHQPFAIDERKGVIADFATQHFADSATLQLLMMNCESIAQYQTSGIMKRTL